MRPPRLAKLAVSALVPDPVREFLLGDLDELYARAVVQGGRLVAWRQYWSQALRGIWHARSIRRHTAAPQGPRRGPDMWNLVTDLRLGVRTLLRTPGYTGVAVLTVALAIGANTLLFSIANPLVARPLPIRNPGTLGWVWGINTAQGVERGRLSITDFLDWRQSAKSFSALAGYSARGGTLSGHQKDSERIQLICATANLTEVWGLTPHLGRLFQPGEDAPGRPLVGVLSHRFWQERFDGDPTVLNRVFLLDGRPVTIVGVMEQPIEIGNLTEIDLWVPQPLETNRPRDERILRVMGRLAPGATVASAGMEIAGLAAAQAHDYPKTNANWTTMVVPTRQAMTGGDTWVILGMLAVVVGFVLLIACANLANLVLARVVARNQDLAVRLSLGASRLQLVRPLVLECLIVGLVGGAIGLGLAQTGLRVIKAVAHEQFMKSLTIDGYVLTFTAILSIVTPVLFSLWPALIAGRSATADTLRDARSSGGGRRARRRRSVLVASQVALALSLLVMSSLTVQSMLNYQRVKLGIDVRHTLMFTIELPRERYGTDEARAQFARDAEAELASLPGVAAGVASQMPIFSPEVPRTFSGTKHDGEREVEKPWAAWHAVTPGFFRAAGIEVVAGRSLDQSDRAGGQGVALLNRTAAEKYFDGVETALGRSVTIADRGAADRPVTIVGVVTDTKNPDVTKVSPQIWVPFAQWPTPAMSVLLASTNPESRAADARAVMRRVDPLVAPSTPKTLAALVEDEISSSRIINGMFTGFALLALVLAAAGLYGAVSYSVGQRRSEIGVRMALGAAPGTIRRMVLGEGLKVTSIGVAIGLLVGVLLARASASVFFGVEANDPVTFAAVTVTVLLVAVAAIWTPAVRAMRVDPARSLRAQ